MAEIRITLYAMVRVAAAGLSDAANLALLAVLVWDGGASITREARYVLFDEQAVPAPSVALVAGPTPRENDGDGDE